MSEGIKQVKKSDLDFNQMSVSSDAAANEEYIDIADEYFDDELYVEDCGNGTYLVYEDHGGELIPMSFINADGVKTEITDKEAAKKKLEEMQNNMQQIARTTLDGILATLTAGAAGSSGSGEVLESSSRTSDKDFAGPVNDIMMDGSESTSSTSNNSTTSTVDNTTANDMISSVKQATERMINAAKEKINNVEQSEIDNGLVEEQLTPENSTSNKSESIVGMVSDAAKAKEDETINTPEFRDALAKSTAEQIADLGEGSPSYKYDVDGKKVSFEKYTNADLRATIDSLGDTEASKKWVNTIKAEQARREAVQHIDLPNNKFVETYDGGETMTKYEVNENGEIMMLPNSNGENLYKSTSGGGGKF